MNQMEIIQSTSAIQESTPNDSAIRKSAIEKRNKPEERTQFIGSTDQRHEEAQQVKFLFVILHKRILKFLICRLLH